MQQWISIIVSTQITEYLFKTSLNNQPVGAHAPRGDVMDTTCSDMLHSFVNSHKEMYIDNNYAAEHSHWLVV